MMTSNKEGDSSSFKHMPLGLVLRTKLIQNLNEMGFFSPTPVQATCIPQFIMLHRDVAAEACTGSGKTLAYLLSIGEVLLRQEEEFKNLNNNNDDDDDDLVDMKFRKNNQWGSIVVVPTRELARQIQHVAEQVLKGCNLNTFLLTGGESVRDDDAWIRKPEKRVDLVIATPGRLSDTLSRDRKISGGGGFIDLKRLEMLILDEADMLLDMGFEQTVNDILGMLPKHRRTGLFSATQTHELKALVRAGLRNPVTVSIKVASSLGNNNTDSGNTLASNNTQKTPTQLENFYLVSEMDERLTHLVQFLRLHSTTTTSKLKAVIFFATCDCVDYYYAILSHFLPKEEFPLFSLHGRMVPKRRNLTYDGFVSSKHGLLICSDVAARGLDIPDIDWIVQFHPPQDPDFFIHRVGRTARAGRKGKALLMIAQNEHAYIPFLTQRRVPIEEYFLEKEVSTNLEDSLRDLAFADRDVLEKGTKGFVSFLRSYKEHKCRYIFQMKDLDLLKVSKAFALLRLPKVSELRNPVAVKGFVPIPLEDVAKIAFKDKFREKQRIEKLKLQKTKVQLQTSKNLAIKKELKLGERKKSQEEEEYGNEKKKTIATAGSGKKVPKRKRKLGLNKQLHEEWDDLAREERLYKQFKKGKISKAEYEKELLTCDI